MIHFPPPRRPRRRRCSLSLSLSPLKGLAAKEVTEALLPGGSLNPPSKAVNPLAATMGGVFGPILVFTLLLEVFLGLGFFQEELDSGLTKAELFNGWDDHVAI